MTRSPGSPAETPTFEQALADLERIVRALEDGQTGLEEALTQYEKGVGLLKLCYGQLNQAEQKIRLLTGVDEAGQAATQPFEHQASHPAGPTAVTLPAPTRRRRRIDDSEG